MPEHTVHDIENKAWLLIKAEGAMDILKLGADILIATALEQVPRKRGLLEDTLHMEYTLLLTSYENSRTIRNTTAIWAVDDDAINKMRKEVDELLKGRRPFHWPLEFPEVFIGDMEEKRGFSAIVSNPPFQGGQKITGAQGTDYRDYIVEYLANGKRGSADLCAYFFLRASQLVHQYGMCGLLATNTVAQGDTREVGLEQITTVGWTIPRAIPSHRWPGEASLEVAYVWLRHGDWCGLFLLNDKLVKGITSFLTSPGLVDGKPYTLMSNLGKSFQGSTILGMGFVLEKDEAQILIEKDPRNKDVLFPLLSGEDFNSRPDQSPSRWVINFHDWPRERAENYIDCMKIIREKVKSERELKTFSKNAREKWWLYERARPELYATIAEMKQVLVCPIVTKYLSFCFVSTRQVFTGKMFVFPFDQDRYLSLLNSSLHETWTREFSATLETRLQYAATDCFENFPFPKDLQVLDVIGELYNQHRQSSMLSRQEGLTKTYNRFHDPQEIAKDIVQLRALHKEMDEVVAKAYGWDGLDLGHGFHETKQGMRYTINEAARREVLGRLLMLNHERYAEEEAMGLHEKGTKNKKGKGQSKRIGKGKDTVGLQGELVFE